MSGQAFKPLRPSDPFSNPLRSHVAPLSAS